jgi:succinate dehydrogenase/fumarate reductase flavoprotein subunit
MPRDEADVVVVGFGAAGAAAAITAADAGAEVLVLEKQPESTYASSTSISAGIVMTVNDVEAATLYLDKCADGQVPISSSRALAQRASRLAAWLEEVGDLFLRRVRGAQHPQFPGADAIEVYTTTLRSRLSSAEVAAGPGIVTDPLQARGETGEDLFLGLRAAVERRSRVRVAWDSPVRRLRTGSPRRVIGVVAGHTGDLEVAARRAVVLACGGFEYDEELKLNYLPVYPAHFYSSPACTGDGVRMAQAVGAALWHMNQMTGRAIFHFELNGVALNFNPTIYPPGASFNRPPESGFLITDRHGRRYANEWDQAIPVKHTFQFKMFEYDAAAGEFPRVPSFWFFDSRRMKAGPLASSGKHLYSWSPDNRREVEHGWISEGQSVTEVARRMGVVDPEQAAVTVAAYNDACAAGHDALGRPVESLIPLDRPPYYCVSLYPGGTNTKGGPKRDALGRVLDPFDAPVAGLYSAGELGQAFGVLYPSSGCGLTEALCSGQAAAESAVNNGA